jgi:N-acetylneuraminate synthase
MKSTAATEGDTARVLIGDKAVGAGAPVFVIAEIGINHNGSLDIAKRLIDGALLAGADAVKFQKRTPEKCVPRDQWNLERDTPWGRMTYIDYRRKVEFGPREYGEIDRYCAERKMLWFASCWDEESVDFMESFNPPCYKVASASLTDTPLLMKKRSTGKPLILSTGMSTSEEIDTAVNAVGRENLLIAHATSSYPCPIEHLNLNMIRTLKAQYPDCPIGYSGHETGLAPTWRRSRWARRSSSGTSRWTARCGAAIRRRRSRSTACSGWSATSVTSSGRWAMASSASTKASWRRARSCAGWRAPRFRATSGSRA